MKALVAVLVLIACSGVSAASLDSLASSYCSTDESRKNEVGKEMCSLRGSWYTDCTKSLQYMTGRREGVARESARWRVFDPGGIYKPSFVAASISLGLSRCFAMRKQAASGGDDAELLMLYEGARRHAGQLCVDFVASADLSLSPKEQGAACALQPVAPDEPGSAAGADSFVRVAISSYCRAETSADDLAGRLCVLRRSWHKDCGMALQTILGVKEQVMRGSYNHQQRGNPGHYMAAWIAADVSQSVATCFLLKAEYATDMKEVSLLLLAERDARAACMSFAGVAAVEVSGRDIKQICGL